MIDIEVTPFKLEHAQVCVDLVERAFSTVPADARPQESPAFLGHLLGDSNPAGATWIAFAYQEGRPVASISAVPARFLTRTREVIVGYQMGKFVVDSSVQRQGLGTRVLEELTSALQAIPGSFVYSYPNTRSLPLFERLGYERIAAIPTLVTPPGARSLLAKNATSFRDNGGETWNVAVAGTSGPVFDPDRFAVVEQPTGFLRDARYFRWRFQGPGTTGRYRTVWCTRPNGDGFGVVLASHVAHRLRFAILVDVFPNVFLRRSGIAIRAAQLAGRQAGEWFVYLNTNARRTRDWPWVVAVPDRRNPRPVTLMFYPNASPIAAGELADSLAMTSDWIGF